MSPEMKQWFEELKARREKELQDRKASGLCISVLHHGPGHQSKTFCSLTGEHDVHNAVYGCWNQEMSWKGDEAFTGYFDEPKEIK